MRFQDYLIEKKDHIIKRLKNLSKEEKDILMPLFSSNNPKLEAMIDWNNKKLTFSDFKSVLDYRSKRSISKGVKKQGIKGLKKNKDYIELKNISDSYNAYIPLSWEASRFIASKNIGGCEGKWCTAYQKDQQYWDEYVLDKGVTLIYLIGNDTKYAVAVYPEARGMYEMFDSNDKEIHDIPDLNISKLNNRKMCKLYKEIHDKHFGRKPSFVDKAKTIDAVYNVQDDDKVEWVDGIWKDGVWRDGTWMNGVWHKGTWMNGVWLDGVWKNGQWIQGIWNQGRWRNGNWLNGQWNEGEWEDGEHFQGIWHEGVWDEGTWHNGTWMGGTWYNGIWKDGIWEDGQWNKGLWHNGTWMNGEWFDGNWKDGTWKDGIWWDGTFEDGTFKGGVWKDGTWEGGTFDGGLWQSGKWILGKWKGGTDRAGQYHDKGDSPDLWDFN
jgi:hypothetical protein